jgi:hypothetical protein
MLDDLVGVIETIQLRIREHRPSLSPNETRTRLALIDPLLTVLGWEVSDPGVVTPEYDVGGGRADYALLDAQSKPIAFIEAKHLDAPLESDRNEEQVVTYATRQRLRFVGLTNGDRWVFDDLAVFSTGRRRLDLTISNTPAHQCALQMLLLWRPNLASGQPIPANEPILVNNTAFTEPQESAAPSPAPLPPAALPTSGDGWVPLSEFNPPAGASPPSVIRFSDGGNVAIRSWREIPTAVAHWLYARQILTVDKLPVPSGRRGYAANIEPFHRDGSPMVTHESIGETSIFINVHLSARASRENTKKILVHCGINPDNVQLQVGE